MKAGVPKFLTRRGGLFGKYVASFVGLVVFVLAVNGALEMWYSYQSTKSALVRAQSDKAEAAAQRVDQFFAELEQSLGIEEDGLRARAATGQVITFGDLVVAASDLGDPSKEPSGLAAPGPTSPP